MNRFFQTLACCTLFTAAATAQSERTASIAAQDNAAPTLSAQYDSHGFVTVTTSYLSAPNGVLLMLGAFDDTMASLGKGLPSILVNSVIVAFTFNAGEALSLSAKYPPMPVMLQAVEANFAPFSVQASKVLRIGGAQSDNDLPPPPPATN